MTQFKTPVLMLIALSIASSTLGDIIEYDNEAEFLADLAKLGYSTLIEDFEGSDWDHVRSDYPIENSEPFVTSKGITWTGNENITTNTNWGRFGTWGIFTVYDPPIWTPDELFCDSEQTLYAVGGWINSNPDFGADIGIEIDGQLVADRTIGNGHQFVGVIYTEGFTSVRFYDIEEESVWGADDFTFGFLEQQCPADVNDDATVNVTDLLALLAAWGQSGVPEDINGDGIVSVEDLLILLAAWGPC